MMGYETKLIIGSVTKDCEYFQVYAIIDLCKTGDKRIGDMANNDEDTGLYFYGFDGNKTITEDRYGKKLKAYPIEDVKEIISDLVKISEYRRYKWAESMLNSISESDSDAMVIAYGH